MTVLHTPQEAARWLRARVRGCLHTDSRRVRAGDGFIAWPGAASDGRAFVAAALAQGALACLVEQAGSERFGFAPDAPVARYAGLRTACGPIADAYYDAPSRALALVAITGTNGKTSTAWWLAHALSALRSPALSPCAIVGTLGIGVPPRLEPTGLTTPDPVRLHAGLRTLVDHGVRACALEASSIGLAEHRLDATAIRVAVFTNFSQDHLDYHDTMAAYWQAKQALFDWPGLQAAVINIDDPRGDALAHHAAARGVDVWTVSLQRPARLRAQDLHWNERGLHWTVHEAQAEQVVDAAVVGAYNAANLMGVLGVMRALGVPLADAAAACAALPAVPGRLERIEVAGAPLAIVDYAHTPDALEQVLRALRPLAERRAGALWCVFGCGGNRDAGKRPLMAAVAERLADRVVVTSDNPRHEDPRAIVDAVLAGLARPDAALVEVDRARAIAAALAAAQPRDVVLIAGKGHEDHQEVAGQRHPFSDQAVARAALPGARP
ncbi:MAG TPA: UDP-N-acetylmuramoyl-L-alanyl-D-glutamate--2,6-diaminopimelate ligase [Ottowia sp.]|uniref:UDP-N-acetylmuramoyl-L-alanyl-D-glutamate--2, 6-diaminopimelate ligase n=1 Tax=Ottowia sp. TaxID=1898956 RepID=UPI002BC951CA|nr:UDP-N-acetylmuramoyl-L-alanyl-D-glutamate--2,6-diaminopimelate ligase [Ottowia sp.]HMN21266.1 UDP-N-acetylmuramoyl-L-alanyl-D-glutamate--2,6-diaminopimelate ligase [Ottowia sp.]